MVVIFICVAMVTIKISMSQNTHFFLTYKLHFGSCKSLAHGSSSHAVWFMDLSPRSSSTSETCLSCDNRKRAVLFKASVCGEHHVYSCSIGHSTDKDKPQISRLDGSFLHRKEGGKNCKSNIIYHPCFYITLACRGCFNSRLLRTKIIKERLNRFI